MCRCGCLAQCIGKVYLIHFGFLLFELCQEHEDFAAYRLSPISVILWGSANNPMFLFKIMIQRSYSAEDDLLTLCFFAIMLTPVSFWRGRSSLEVLSASQGLAS